MPSGLYRRRWLQETIAGYNAQLQRQHGVEMHLRLGLNTGQVVVGRIGDDLRMDYTAVGNITHLAARRQALATPGTILLIAATYRLVAGYIRSEALERISFECAAYRQGPGCLLSRA